MTQRLDYQLIAQWVPPYAKVLDLGCGTGDLLETLALQKSVSAQGIELNEEAIYACVEKGITVFHGDIESGLGEYPDKSFEVVILNQSIQEVQHFDFVLQEALRVGWKVIIAFPNFAFISSRIELLWGRSPVTKALPYSWHNSPNKHFFSIKDFEKYCVDHTIYILKRAFIRGTHSVHIHPNLFAELGIYEITTNIRQLTAQEQAVIYFDGEGI